MSFANLLTGNLAAKLSKFPSVYMFLFIVVTYDYCFVSCSLLGLSKTSIFIHWPITCITYNQLLNIFQSTILIILSIAWSLNEEDRVFPPGKFLVHDQLIVIITDERIWNKTTPIYVPVCLFYWWITIEFWTIQS